MLGVAWECSFFQASANSRVSKTWGLLVTGRKRSGISLLLGPVLIGNLRRAPEQHRRTAVSGPLPATIRMELLEDDLSYLAGKAGRGPF